MKKETKKLIAIIWQILLTSIGAAFLWMHVGSVWVYTWTVYDIKFELIKDGE